MAGPMVTWGKKRTEYLYSRYSGGILWSRGSKVDHYDSLSYREAGVQFQARMLPYRKDDAGIGITYQFMYSPSQTLHSVFMVLQLGNKPETGAYMKYLQPPADQE